MTETPLVSIQDPVQLTHLLVRARAQVEDYQAQMTQLLTEQAEALTAYRILPWYRRIWTRKPAQSSDLFGLNTETLLRWRLEHAQRRMRVLQVALETQGVVTLPYHELQPLLETT